MAKKQAKRIYEPYLELEEMVDGINRGNFIQSTIRINQKNYNIAFIANPEKGQKDILVEKHHKNRALNGDIVVAKLLDREHWKLNKSELTSSLMGSGTESMPVIGENSVTYDNKEYNVDNVEEKFLQKTATIVGILEKKHPRKAMGYAKVYNANYALFSPLDSRVPRILIPLEQFPNGFAERPKDFAQNIMIALIERWEITGMFAMGSLVKSIGSGKDDLIKAATEGILIENDLDYIPFPDDVDDEIPDFNITQQDIDERREFDFRKKCVFTIDPATARDLDDACSVEILGEDLFEIGVHIADVSHFVKPGTNVDEIARRRTTSVYLVQRVVPMLPRKLCENYCSLNPGIDRFSFSVLWRMNHRGEILDTKFGKSLIRSCCKLHYEHAQDMIENPEREFPEGYLPEIHNGFTASDISGRVNVLHSIAQNLREKRKESGSLSIQQCKISFSLNKENGMPTGLGSYKSRESHKLIEEFMLSANVSVAEKLLKHYPENAIIRRHLGPKEDVMRDTRRLLRALRLDIDTSCSKSIQESLNKLKYSNNVPTPVGLVASSLIAKCMTLATYHSSGEFESESDYFHYGLSMPLYTHFTSPIRRYPDLIAHRQLQSILEEAPDQPMSFDEVSALAERSSEKKYASKLASDKSSELFLWLFLRENVNLLEPAVVVEIGSESITVLVLRYALQLRLWKDYMEKGVGFQSKEMKWATISWPKTDTFKAVTKQYKLLDEIVVKMKAADQLFKINGVIARPQSYSSHSIPDVGGVVQEDA